MQTEGRGPMNLPEFLTSDDGGFINLTGHRIGLHHVVRVYEDGCSPEIIVGHSVLDERHRGVLVLAAYASDPSE
jgi:hypothetical protein